MMMNVIALSLVFSSIAFASIWSPTPPQKQEENVLHKGGHRAVLVEYADTAGGEGGETKVLISPSSTANKQRASLPDSIKHPTETVGDELSSAAASVVGVAEKATGGPKEVICDVYGKCKEKISDVLHRGKDKVVDQAEEGAREAADRTKEKAYQATETVRGGAKEAVGKTKETADAAKETVRGGAQDVADKAKEAANKATETMEGSAAKMGEKAREAAQATVDKSKKAAEDLSGRIGDMKDEAKEEAKKLGEKGKKELSDITRRGKEVIYDIYGYLFSTETVNSLTNVVQLMGLATAYGVSIWVTFVMSHVLVSVLPRQQFGIVQSKIYPVYFKVMASGIGAALLGHLLGQRRKLFEDGNKAGLFQVFNLLSSLGFIFYNLLVLEPRATKVMFERLKLEKEEGRGREAGSFTGGHQQQQSRRVVDTYVTESAGPVTTDAAAGQTTTNTPAAGPTMTSTAAAPNAESPEQLAVRTKMQNLNLRLKKTNSLSSLLNVLALMGLTWHLFYVSQRLAAC